MLNKIWLFLEAFWEKIVDVFDWLITSMMGLSFDLLKFICDTIFDGILWVLNTIDVSALDIVDAVNSWSLLPKQILYILDQIDLRAITKNHG